MPMPKVLTQAQIETKAGFAFSLIKKFVVQKRDVKRLLSGKIAPGWQSLALAPSGGAVTRR